MNWGYRIVLSFIFFASFVFYLVFRMIGSGNDLLKAKYYRSGMEINTELKLLEASSKLSDQLQIVRQKNEANLNLIFTEISEPLEGDIELICLGSDKSDLKTKIDLQKIGNQWVQEIKIKVPQIGTWLLEINGNQGNKPFLIRKQFHY